MTQESPPGSLPTSPSTFEEAAPISLCKDIPSSEPDSTKYYDAIGVFVTDIVKSHEGHVLMSRPWKCIICKKPATGLMSGAIPLLKPPSGREPKILDSMAPICLVGGLCATQANQVPREFLKTSLPKTTDVKDDLTFCGFCGKTSGLKLCNGCNSSR